MPTKTSNNDSPPWQVLVLLAPLLDPKTLAISSCVSKSWSISMSSDHLWKPLCTAHFPSLSSLHIAAAVPYRRIYLLGWTSANLRHRKPPKPRLSLSNLIFTVTIHHNNQHLFTVTKPGSELRPGTDPDGVFWFNNIGMGRASPERVQLGATRATGPAFGMESIEFWAGDEAEEGLKATWNVISEGYKGLFTMVDCRGKGRFVSGSDGWFSEELPPAGCCSGVAACGLVAEVRLGLKERESGGGRRRRMVVEKVGVGVLNILNWRYVSIEDALRYLQHFLVPC